MSNHIAVLPFPFATHAGLLLGLVQRLANASPSSTFTFFSTSKSNSSLFTTPKNSQHPNIKRFDIPDGVPEGYDFSAAGGGIEGLIGMFFKSAPENIRKAIAADEVESGTKISCVVSDAFMWFTGEIAAEVGVSWVPVWTSAAGSLSAHVYTDLIRENVGVVQGTTGRDDEILRFIPGFAELRLGDLPSGVVSGNLESPFSIMLHKMATTLPKAIALPINSFEELDPPIVEDLKSKFNNFLNVGPFNLTSPPPSSNISDEHGCITWLDKQEPGSVAYLGFGTVATPPPNELKAIAEALEETKTPFLWSLKDNFKCHFPQGFLERTSEYGKIVSWAPQVQVLGHGSIGVFINHCGWNSVLESIAAGVPMISRPFFGDHHLNTWMVERVWRIGVRIEGGVFTKSGTMHALDLVLSQKSGDEMKHQIGMYKKLALEAVGPSGSSTTNFKKLVEIISPCK